MSTASGLGSKCQGRVFIVNVGTGTKSATRGIRSPVFEDRTFEIVPLPEDYWGEPIPDPSHSAFIRYSHLAAHNDPTRQLAAYVPLREQDKAVHNDPDFEALTYGGAGADQRSSALWKVEVGDYLFFVDGLTKHDGSRFLKDQGSYGKYWIGFLEVSGWVDPKPEDVLKRNTKLASVSDNAHVRKYRATRNPQVLCRIFVGVPERSRRFEKAVPISRKSCEYFLRDKDGLKWNWYRGETSTIGSYMRTNRCFFVPGTKQYDAFWEYIEKNSS